MKKTPTQNTHPLLSICITSECSKSFLHVLIRRVEKQMPFWHHIIPCAQQPLKRHPCEITSNMFLQPPFGIKQFRNRIINEGMNSTPHLFNAPRSVVFLCMCLCDKLKTSCCGSLHVLGA